MINEKKSKEKQMDNNDNKNFESDLEYNINI